MRRWLTFASTIGIIALVSLAQSSGEPVVAVKAVPVSGMECWCACSEIEILDGDTIRSNVHLPFGVCLLSQTIRANDFDAYESSKRRHSEASGEIKDEEVIKGKRCTKELCDILSEPDTYLYIKPGLQERDTYGRLLASWSILKGNKRTPVREIAARKNWIRK